MKQTESIVVRYAESGYRSNGAYIIGRARAGASFLNGLVKYGQYDWLGAITRNDADFAAFRQAIQAAGGTNEAVRRTTNENRETITESGILYTPDPAIAHCAWMRRQDGDRAYSLCGITHTIATASVMKMVGDALIAPTQRWDAIICTSQSVRNALRAVIEGHIEYLEERTGGRVRWQPRLPIIHWASNRPNGFELEESGGGAPAENSELRTERAASPTSADWIRRARRIRYRWC